MGGSCRFWANNAIDGDLQTDTRSECNDKGQEIWLKLMLSRPALIDYVVVYPTNVDNSFYYWLQGAQVFTEDVDSGEEVLCGTLTLDSVNASHRIKCGVREVRAVVIRLQKDTWACIHIYEIEAFREYIEGKL